jgi:signal transduction histidine kinase
MNGLRAARCRFECPEPVMVDNPFIAGHLYRIAQEAVNNATKHAGASQITIRLESKAGSLLLEVSDDGKGLPKKLSGVGLGVMQHRAKLIGGELQIASKRGVKVTCRVPIRK